jgi:hypothetical protein
MAQLQYTAEVKAGLLLELPEEAHELHLQPGDKVRVQVHREHQEMAKIAPNKGKRVSALGKYAFVPGGSEEFAKEKQVETEREDRARQ